MSNCTDGTLSFDFQSIGNLVLLFILMLGCGMAISLAEFKSVFKQPRGIIVAMFGQFVFLPLMGFAMARAFRLNPIQSVGLVVMTSAPGGSTSNIFCLLFQADPVLSIAATTVSSFLAVGMMPLNQYLYITVAGLAGNVCVQVTGIVLSAVIVLIGVVVGILIKPFLQKRKFFITIKILFGLSSISALAIVLLAFVTNAQSQVPFWKVEGEIAGAGIVTFTLALVYGFVVSTLVGLKKPTRFAVMLEVSIQNAFVALAIVNIIFPDPAIRAEAVAAPAIYAIYGLFASFFGGIVAWKLGQTDLNPNESFIKAFKDVMKKRAEENAKAVFGDSPNDSNHQALVNNASTVNPAFDSSKVEQGDAKA